LGRVQYSLRDIVFTADVTLFMLSHLR
jgi:hypothetical protein